MAQGIHILVVEGRFYDDISDALLKGAVDVLKAAGATHEVVTVPGILEIPAAAQYGLSRGSNPTTGGIFSGFIALGCAIKGETHHYEHVSREAMAGVSRVALDLKMPAGNAILTCPTEKLAKNRSNPKKGDAGGRAARACLRLIEIKRGFGL